MSETPAALGKRESDDTQVAFLDRTPITVEVSMTRLSEPNIHPPLWLRRGVRATWLFRQASRVVNRATTSMANLWHRMRRADISTVMLVVLLAATLLMTFALMLTSVDRRH